MNTNPPLQVTVKHNCATVLLPLDDPKKPRSPLTPGPIPQPFFPHLAVESVADDLVVLTDGTERRELRPGGSVMFIHGDATDCYDGSTVGDEYTCMIEWREPVKVLRMAAENRAGMCVSCNCAFPTDADLPVDETYNLVGFLPPIYHPYIKPIYATRRADGSIEIESEYGNKTLAKPGARLEIPEIGLSFAYCNLTITRLPD